jgi:hypothetical protein
MGRVCCPPEPCFVLCVPQLGNGVTARVGALKEAAVAPADLLLGVAGQVLEGAIGKDDGIVRQVGIGEDDQHPGHLDGREEHVARSWRPSLVIVASCQWRFWQPGFHRIDLGAWSGLFTCSGEWWRRNADLAKTRTSASIHQYLLGDA